MNHRRKRPRRPEWQRKFRSYRNWGRDNHPNNEPRVILADWTDSEPEDKEHADDKRQLDQWSDYYRQTAALGDDDPWQELLRMPADEHREYPG